MGITELLLTDKIKEYYTFQKGKTYSCNKCNVDVQYKNLRQHYVKQHISTTLKRNYIYKDYMNFLKSKQKKQNI